MAPETNAASGQAAPPFSYFADITDLVGTINVDSIVSRTFLKQDGAHLIVFGFAPGQELSEHTAARAAILYFVRGRADLTLGAEAAVSAGPGTMAYMQPFLPHSVVAKEETIMLLIMLERPGKATE